MRARFYAIWVIGFTLSSVSTADSGMSASVDRDAKIIRVGEDYPDLASAIAAVPTIRGSGGTDRAVVIELPPGVTRLTEPALIDTAHGGTLDSPLIIRGASDGSSQLVGSIPIVTRTATPADFYGKPVPRGARTFPLGDINVPALGLRPRGATIVDQHASIEIYQGGAQLWNARWPNRGFVKAKLIRADSPGSGPVALFPGARQSRWINEPSLWIGGRWARGWDFEMTPVLSVNPVTGDVQAAPRRRKIPPSDTPQLFIANALGELDAPGEYVVDGKRKQVTFLPLHNGGSSVEVAVAANLLVLTDAQNVVIENVGFNRTLGPAVEIRNSKHVRLYHCAVRQTGGNGIDVNGGSNVVITNSVVNGVAETGIALQGGDRQTLTPARHRVVDSIVANFGREEPDFRPGIKVTGVGNEVRGSLVAGGAHAGIILSGNDHTIAENEVTRVALASNDVGAISMGRDWTFRGNKIEGNLIHDFGPPVLNSSLLVVGIYLDDQMSGVAVKSNVIIGGTAGVFIHGGRENVIRRNVFVGQLRAALRFENSGMNTQKIRRVWQAQSINDQLIARLNEVPVDGNIWRQRYPTLGSLRPSQLVVPEGNVFEDNVVLGALPIIAPKQPTIISMISHSGNLKGLAPANAGDLDSIRRTLAGAPRMSSFAKIIQRPESSLGLCDLMSSPLFSNSATNPNISEYSYFSC